MKKENEQVINLEENEPHKAIVSLVVEIKKDKVDVKKLEKILKAKEKLIKKALDIDDVSIKVEGDIVKFAWFNKPLSADESRAYVTFISKLCQFSTQVNRASDKVKEAENEKYAFRCFLLKLGFIGDEYKEERKILLKRLEGSSAFRKGKENTHEVSR